MTEIVGWQCEVVEVVGVTHDFLAIKEGLRLLLNKVKKAKRNGYEWSYDFSQMLRK